MFHILQQFNIPTSLHQAVEFIREELSEDAIHAFNKELNLSVHPDNALKAAQYAASAILSGADTLAKIETSVARKVAMLAPAPVVVAPVVAVVNEITVTEVVDVPAPGEAVVVEAVATSAKRGRGRPKLEETAYDKAIKLMNGATDRTRPGLMNLLLANAYAKKSAYVYVWKALKTGALAPRQ